MSANCRLIMDEGGATRVVMTESFVESLGASVVAVEIAPAGTRMREGETFGFVQTARGTADLRAPAAMRVLRVNAAVLSEPRLATASHDGRGWLAEVETAGEDKAKSN